jgi:outer membrane scaffolding protein for murein synthesis (MipA/OmpV family)
LSYAQVCRWKKTAALIAARPAALAAALAASMLAALLPAGAQAQGTLEDAQLEQRGFGALPPTGGDWNVNLGAGLGWAPTYLGASAYHARVLPLVLVSYRDLVFFSPAGLGVNLVNVGGFRAGPILGYQGGRNQGDDSHLYGLGDISSSITAGVFASYRTGPFRFFGTVRQAITHTDNGIVGLLQADIVMPVLDNRQLLLAAGPEIEFTNARYSQTWFGVTPAQSQQSLLPVYNAGAGVRDVGLHASLSYLVSPHVVLRLLGSVKELTGDDADSPIVQAKTQATIGFGAAYHF